MIELDQIYCEDCLGGMKRIPDASVDCIITDLPYGTTACQWDSVIPFEPLWEQYRRITKPNAAIVLFGSEPFSSALRMSNIKEYRYDWYWRKPKGTGHLNAAKQPMRDVEVISVFYRQQSTYNPQYTKGEPFGNKSGKAYFTSEAGETTYGKFASGPGTRNDNPGIRYPKQCIEFGVVERDTLHPTQKPVDLLRYLVLTYTDVGGGSSRLLHGQRHNGHRLSEGASPLPRLRAEQGVFRHRPAAHRFGASAAAAGLRRRLSRPALSHFRQPNFVPS